MERVDAFELVKHERPYESWPRRTQLKMHGKPTETQVRGYTLCAQYRCGTHYLLVTDWACPFEEQNEFLLLRASDLKIISTRNIGPSSSILVLGHANGLRRGVGCAS